MNSLIKKLFNKPERKIEANIFSKYIGCKYLICHNTFSIDVECDGLVENFNHTFHKGEKYNCRVGNTPYAYEIGHISFDIDFDMFYGIIFDTTDKNDIDNILNNFHTQIEHRKFLIEDLI